VPVLADLATEMFIWVLPEPGAAIKAGLKLTVAPEGWPDAVKVIAELKPPETDVVTTA
jgi:hypothetical protein